MSKVVLFTAENENKDKKVYVGVTDKNDIDLLTKNEIINKDFVDIKFNYLKNYINNRKKYKYI